MKKIVFKLLYSIPGLLTLIFLLLPVGELKLGLFINMVLWLSFLSTFLIALLESLILKNNSGIENRYVFGELLIIDAFIYAIALFFQQEDSGIAGETLKMITILNIESLLGFISCKYVKRFVAWMIRTANS